MTDKSRGEELAKQAAECVARCRTASKAAQARVESMI
jgi:hypothetical protein